MVTGLRRKWIQEKKLKKTKTSLFLLPLLGKSSGFYSDFFIDSYLYFDNTDYHIVTAFDNVDNDDMRMGLWYLENHFSFEGQDTDDDNREILSDNILDSSLIKDVELFLQGKYSNISKSTKEKILKVCGNVSSEDGIGANGLPKVTQFDVLNPNVAKRKKMAEIIGVAVADIKEVYSPPDKEIEMYKTIEELKAIHGS